MVYEVNFERVTPGARFNDSDGEGVKILPFGENAPFNVVRSDGSKLFILPDDARVLVRSVDIQP